nr:glycoside hydrolase family protein [Lusitaniella coriacea]
MAAFGRESKTVSRRSLWKIAGISLTVLGLFAVLGYRHLSPPLDSPHLPLSASQTRPLVMEGGNSYIRALMRTITVSEANDPQPYAILYGGKYFQDFTRHPQRCVPIVTPPNLGNCSTAAGRYQFLDITWAEKAARYHPQGKTGFLWWKTYSFAPEYQDTVVHAWLSDPNAWGVDIPKLLRQGKIHEVLRLLSGTWTSLGYGIETNSASKHLPSIYQKVLQEELAHSQQARSR